MDYSETNSSGTDFISFPLITENIIDSFAVTCDTIVVVEDKDWMPYRYFEYYPEWHKKFAAIKYQIDKMWD